MIDDEFYTPAHWITAARDSMNGRIDLDPASCAMANLYIKATKYYDKYENGLNQEWQGNVWCNPPFSGRNIPKWWRRCLDHDSATCFLFIMSDSETTQQALKLSDWICVIVTLNHDAGWRGPKNHRQSKHHSNRKKRRDPGERAPIGIAGLRCEPSPLWNHIGVLR